LNSSFRRSRTSSEKGKKKRRKKKGTVQPGCAFEDAAFKPGFAIVKF
jgi:hypothetical protein